MSSNNIALSTTSTPTTIQLFNNVTVTSSKAFLFLSVGTVLSIGISCAAEEFILKRIEGFTFYWFLALFELVVFSGMTFLTSFYYAGGGGIGIVGKGGGGGAATTESNAFFIATPLKAPLHLYVASASLIGIYTSLGKVSYKYINYATGTVLKSSKLIPVIVLSSVWLKRTYHYLDYLACVLLVIASCFFAVGEHEGNKSLGVEDPTLYAFGFFLSFFCVCVGAVQSNVVDKALRDYQASVSENMFMTNSIGALLVFVVVLVKEPDAFAFFFGDWFYLSLITFRSVVFWLGAVFYTTLVKHFGAVPAVAVTTCRKVLTVVSSFVFFSSDKPFGATYFVALLFFFGAVACEFLKHKFPTTPTKSQQLEMARKDSDVEKLSDRN
jgi:adenosine 3'-phospho 5'-phosphosulfate transporter B3